jgi:predicted DCC family thiol-disulfide oxidoreductase YuxK
MEQKLIETSQHPVVLFDGVCNLCNGLVKFLIRQDKHSLLRFAPLQSEAAAKLLGARLPDHGIPDSFIFIKDGKIYARSDAALNLAGILPWYWQWLQLFRILPKPLRDLLYKAIAKRRYNWFGKKSACMVPTPELRSRFL